MPEMLEHGLCAALEVSLVPYQDEDERDERVEASTLEERPLTQPLTLALER